MNQPDREEAYAAALDFFQGWRSKSLDQLMDNFIRERLEARALEAERAAEASTFARDAMACHERASKLREQKQP